MKIHTVAGTLPRRKGMLHPWGGRDGLFPQIYTEGGSPHSHLRKRQHGAPAAPGLAEGVTQHEWTCSRAWLLSLCRATRATQVSWGCSEPGSPGAVSAAGLRLSRTEWFPEPQESLTVARLRTEGKKGVK